jgi:hypothetical protein
MEQQQRFFKRSSLELTRIQDMVRPDPAAVDETIMRDILNSMLRMCGAAEALGFQQVAQLCERISQLAQDFRGPSYDFGLLKLQFADLTMQLRRALIDAQARTR